MPRYPKVRSRTIEYDSPSGFVHIGKYIPPFEKVENGFGFLGVIVEDSQSGKLQCHICGRWLEQMGIHLRDIHQTNGYEYKERFGLMSSTALKSKKMRLKQSKIMKDNRNKNKSNRYKFKKNNLFASNRKGTTKALEVQNKYGICDLQIIQRILELKKELGKTPTLIQLSQRYKQTNIIWLIHRRFGSYVSLCNQLGMTPVYSNYFPKYSRQYFIEKALSNVASHKIMTVNEGRAFYRYFRDIKELRVIVKHIKENQIA